MAKRCAALAFAHGIAKVSISTSLIMFTTCPMVGVPRMMGTLITKLEKSRDDQGLFDLHHSPEPLST